MMDGVILFVNMYLFSRFQSTAVPRQLGLKWGKEPEEQLLS